jgi:two-component system cell cycle sensor histidine kinase/response regulator CckA
VHRILIVDDEPAIVNVLCAVLAAPEREFLTAYTAEQAMARILAAPAIEVAILDKNLPDRTGLAVGEALKARHPDSEFILLTGYASLDSAIAAVRAGAYDYVQKPVDDFDALQLKLVNAVEKVRLKRERAALIARLQESEQRYRGVFEAASDGLLLVDEATGAICDANAAATRMYGLARGALVGKPLQELELQNALGAPRHRRGDGAPFPVEVSQGRLASARGDVRVLAVRDISERQRAEQERATLESHLRQAQKMDAMGRLAGGVAHDFNNLLTVVLGNSDLLLAGEHPEETREERLREIIDAASRAAALTRQLLTFSRKKQPRLEPVSLNAVVQDMVKLFGRTLGERVQIVSSLEKDLWRAVADPDQLSQVVLNLAVNARDAMPNGGKLVLETANVELGPAGEIQEGLAPGRYALLAVSDSGTGMTKEVQEQIFEPFFTTKEQGKGTGLGLATVYGIVKGAGGGLAVHSEVGRGTTMKVYLPATARTAAAAPSEAPPAPRAGKGELILVAEDEAAVRSLVARLLSGNGYQVVEAGDGEEALALAGRQSVPPAALVADLAMPRMSGRELAKVLRATSPAVRVLYVSGWTEQAALECGHCEPGEDYLFKPFNEEQLLRRVGALLEDGSRP